MKTKLLCAILGSLLVYSPFALAAGDTVTSGTGPKIGTWVTEAKPQNFTNPIGNGSFKTIMASSKNSSDGTDSDTLPQPLPYVTAAGANATYATRQTIATGIKFEARSKVSVAVTATTATTASWDVTAADFGIQVLAPTGVTGETATATWKVTDPMNFGDLEFGDLISVGFTPEAGGWDLSLLSPSGAYSSGGFSGSAGTSLTGYEDLFGWDFWADSIQLGTVQGAFHSNPLLGWDDAALTSEILSRFSYDSALNDYTFNSAGLMFAAEIAVPEGVSSVSVTTSLGATVTASVPDCGATATLFVLGVGSLLLVKCRSHDHA